MKNKYLKKLDDASYDYLRLDILRNILYRKDAKEIIKEIFPILTKRDYFSAIAPCFLEFLLVYKDNFSLEIDYILESKIVSLEYLISLNINEVICSTSKAIDAIIQLFNIPNIDLYDIKNSDMVSLLTNYIINNRLDLFGEFMNTLVKLGDDNLLHQFFITLVRSNTKFDYNLLLDSLRSIKAEENMTSFSNIPNALLQYNFFSEELLKFLIDNFEELLTYEKDKKYDFLWALYRYLPKEIKEKYEYLIRLNNASILRKHNEECINILLTYQKEEWIRYFIGNKSITSFNERMGTTAEVFKVGDDNILKLALTKHDEDSETEHFLLGPTKQDIIKDENGKPILYVEKQKLHLQEYDGIPLNDEDLDNFFNELDKCDLEINDPHCMARDFHNFGFLNDYHEATLVGVSSHEELPDWFKKRPVVMFDIDMVRKKTVEEKRRFSF